MGFGIGMDALLYTDRQAASGGLARHPSSRSHARETSTNKSVQQSPVHPGRDGSIQCSPSRVTARPQPLCQCMQVSECISGAYVLSYPHPLTPLCPSSLGLASA
jgi:hypothetical protein